MSDSGSVSKWPVLFAVFCTLIATIVASRSTRAQDAGSPGAAPTPWLVSAVVVDVHDPDALGRIKVKFPSLPRDAEAWARVALPLGGNRTGLWALPEVGDEVLVGFEHGDVHAPVVIGSLWNGAPPPPCERCS